MTHEVVKLEDVWVHYNGVPALEDVNLTIGPNDFLGIIGPNGGGKTTLLKMGCYARTGLFRRYGREARGKVRDALATMNMLDRKDRQIGELSDGEQQRVLIARALVADPAMLLLDEPTASVDSAMQTEFYDLLDSLKQRMAIVLVSHDVSAISVHVDKMACLNRELFYHGSPEIDADILEATYKCPVQMIAHGVVPHRVLKEH